MLKHILKSVYRQNLQLIRKTGVNYILSGSYLNKPYFLKPNLEFSYRSIHICAVKQARLFYDHENAFAFNIINKDPLLSTIKCPTGEVRTLEDFDATLNQNWRDSSASEIVKVFTSVEEYCVQNGITVSDTRFDKLVDGLMDHCETLSTNELLQLFSSLCKYPPTDSYTAHNFHDIWSCLDDICCWKMIEWDTDTMFVVADFWYKLSLGKFNDYTFVLIDRLCKKAELLSKDQLVKVFFYFNVCRRRAVDFEYEYALERQIDNMNIDEMAVIAMGYFKTKTKIKLRPIMLAMVQQVIENSKSVHEISLTAILKILRYSKPTKILPQIDTMLDKLTDEIDRLSDLCCLHIALIGTGIQFVHKKTLRKVAEKLVKDITIVENIRLKDIERLLNVLSMFNFDPMTEPDVYKAAFEELHKDERLKECLRYPRCMPCALNYLSLRNIYSYELMDRILNVEFIKETYGKNAKNIPHVLLSLDASIDVECPDYKGNRLPLSLKYKAAKWLTDFTPSYNQYKKITAGDQLVLDTIDTVKDIVKDEKYIYIDHVLPHFSRADIILTRNKATGDFVEPRGFENYVLGDVMFPIKDDSIELFAVVILGWNNTIRDTSLPLGQPVMKERQLRKIGYNPVFVIWNEFLRLSKEERVQYILEKLSR